MNLTIDEANEVLSELGHLTLSTIRHNHTLMDAINKMNGTYQYPASAGCGDFEESRQKELVISTNNKIEAIKMVRFLTGWGLKIAKDYVDASRGELTVLQKVCIVSFEEAKSEASRCNVNISIRFI